MTTRKVLVLTVVVVLAGGVLAFAMLSGDDDQSKIEVRASDGLPVIGDLNRADDLGADVVRAYLQAALSCTANGERLMRELSRRGEATARRVMRDACQRSSGQPFADRLDAETIMDGLDPAGRSLWRVTAPAGELPPDVVLRVRQSAGSDGWEIDRLCTLVCPG